MTEDEPPDGDEVEDPGSAAWECDLDAMIAECRRITAEEAAACARAARLGQPGGQPVELGAARPGGARIRAARTR